MDRQKLAALAHSDHPISAPVSESVVDSLLDRAIRRPDAHVLDLGCGEGAWLLRALRTHPDITAVGVDISQEGFDRTLQSATRLGVEDRLELLQQDVRRYQSPRKADVVLSVGAAYAFGELLPTLRAAREHLAEDGTVLLGDSSGNASQNPLSAPRWRTGPRSTPTCRPWWTTWSPTGGRRCMDTSAPWRNGMTTSGVGPAHWQAGHSTILIIQTANKLYGYPPNIGTAGSTATAEYSGSSFSCFAPRIPGQGDVRASDGRRWPVLSLGRSPTGHVVCSASATRIPAGPRR